MKKNLLLPIAFLFSLTLFAQTYNGPESVEYDAAGDRYFISNTGTGSILARDNSGNLTTFASGLTSGPHGLEIVGNTLYACSGGTIKGYDLSNGNQIVNVNLSGTFLNGITHKGTDLFITDFSAKKVYRFNTLNNSFNVFITGLTKTPNGIIYDDINDRLVMVNWGSNAPVIEINLSDSTYSTLTATTLGNCDGIAMNCSGQFYVASWSPARISRFENDFVATPVNMNVSGLNSPADIVYNQTEDTLAIPNSGNNTVTFVQYNDCASVGIDETVKTNFSFYPNPSNGIIQLKGNFTNDKITIRNIIGEIVYQTNANGSLCKIDLSSHDNGVYFITLNNQQTEKLILQK